MKKNYAFFILLSLVTVNCYSQFVPQSGLIAYYSFNGNAQDNSGNNHHMTVSGATLVSSRYGQANHAYRFDGINDLIYYTDTLPLSGDCTWSFWASIDTFQNSAIIYNGNTNSNGYGFGINSGQNPSQGSFGDKITFFSGGINYNISIPFQSNEFSLWHHFVLTKSANDYKLYIDNVLRDSSVNSFFTPIGKFHLGMDYTDNSNPFKGRLDDIALYNRVLTVLEIDTLFKGCGPQVATDPGNKTVLNGNTTILTVTGSFSSQTLFQWQMDAGTGFFDLMNNGMFSGINDDTLVISNVPTTLNNNSFRVIVTSDIGCKDTSANAKLFIIPNSVDGISSQKGIFAYPNPSMGKISFKVAGTHQSEYYFLTVKNVLGQQLFKEKLSGRELNDLTIDLEAEGIYMLSIFDREYKNISNEKIVIVR